MLCICARQCELTIIEASAFFLAHTLRNGTQHTLIILCFACALPACYPNYKHINIKLDETTFHTSLKIKLLLILSFIFSEELLENNQIVKPKKKRGRRKKIPVPEEVWFWKTWLHVLFYYCMGPILRDCFDVVSFIRLAILHRYLASSYDNKIIKWQWSDSWLIIFELILISSRFRIKSSYSKKFLRVAKKGFNITSHYTWGPIL